MWSSIRSRLCTTLEAAHRLNRQWIGIDIAIHAVVRVRLTSASFTIQGVPRNVAGSLEATQKWAVEQVDRFVTTRRTADGGIAGRLYFDVPTERDLWSLK